MIQECGLIVFLAVIAIGYIVRIKGSAFIIAACVRFLLSSSVKRFNLNGFTVVPFVIDGLEVTIKGNRKRPEASMSFKLFKFTIQWKNILRPVWEVLLLESETTEATMDAHKIFCFELVDFSASSPNLKFADLLNPPENKGPTVNPNPNILPLVSYSRTVTFILQRIVQYCMLFFEIKFVHFNFEFVMPTHGSVMQGFANEMIISFPNKNRGNPESVQMKMAIAGGIMDIMQNKRRALLYSGKYGVMRVEMHMPTGIMDLHGTLTGTEDDIEVHIQPLLAFLEVYQAAEDAMVELKLARLISVASKMTMSAEFHYMKAGVYDDRCPNIIVMHLWQVFGELKTYKLSLDSARCYQNKLCAGACSSPGSSSKSATLSELYKSIREFVKNPVIYSNKMTYMSDNLEKVMLATFQKIEFEVNHYDTQSTAVVEDGSLIKTLRVINSGDFIDQDHMDIRVRRVKFEHIVSPVLEWLMSLQDASNVMPVSRFAHLKESLIEIRVEHMVISTQPVSFQFDPLNPVFLDSEEEGEQEVHTPIEDPAIGASLDVDEHDPHSADGANSNQEALKRRTSACASNLPKFPTDFIPLDERRLVTFQMEGMYVVKRAILNTLDSEYSVEFDHFEIHTALPTLDLEEQYQLTVGIPPADLDRPKAADIAGNGSVSRSASSDGLPNISIKSSGSNNFFSLKDPKSLEEDNGETAIESHSETGTKWVFEDLRTTFRMGVKLTLHTVTMDKFSIDLCHCHVMTTQVPSVGSIARDFVTRSESFSNNFMTTSNLNAVWSGLDVHCDMGSTKTSDSTLFDDLNPRSTTIVNASVAGAVKVLCGYNMIRKAVDRITLRMEQAKRAGLYYRGLPVPPKASSVNVSIEESRHRHRHHHHNHHHGHHHHRGHSPLRSPKKGASVASSVPETAAPPVVAVTVSLRIEFYLETPSMISTADPSRRPVTRVSREALNELAGDHNTSFVGSQTKDRGGTRQIEIDELVVNLDAVGEDEEEEEDIGFKSFSEYPSESLRPFSFKGLANLEGGDAELSPSPIPNGARKYSHTSLVAAESHSSGSRTEKPTNRAPLKRSRSLKLKRSAIVGSFEAGGGPIVRNNRRMFINFSDLHVSTADRNMTVKFVECTMTCSNFVEKNFLLIQDFEYIKKMVPFSNTPSVSHLSAVKKADLTVNIKVIELGMGNEMKLGTALDAMMAQYNAYSAVSATAAAASGSNQSSSAFEDFYSDSSTPATEGGVGSTASALMVDEDEDDDDDPSPDQRIADEYDSDEERQRNIQELTDALPVPNIAVNAPPYAPYTTRAEIGALRLNMDAEYRNQMIVDYMMIEWSGIDLTVNSLLEDCDVQDVIGNADFGPELVSEDGSSDLHHSTAGMTSNIGLSGDKILGDFVMYQGIQGGDIDLKIANYTLFFQPFPEPYIKCVDSVFRGFCYNAAATDSRIPIEYDVVTLADSVPHHFTANNGRLDTLTPHPYQNTNPLYSIVAKSIAPPKIYMDMTWSARLVELHQRPETDELLLSMFKMLEQCNFPNKDASPELPFWDNMRFWSHGEFCMKFDTFVIKQSTHDFMSKKVLLLISMNSFVLHINRDSVELTGHNNSIDAEITTQLLARRFRQQGKAAHAGMAGANKYKGGVPVKVNILTLPGLVFSLRHKSVPDLCPITGRRQVTHTHHDVYLTPAFVALPGSDVSSSRLSSITPSKQSDPYTVIRVPKYRTRHSEHQLEADKFSGQYLLEYLPVSPEYLHSDRFYYFRSRKMTNQWGIEMRFADAVNTPIQLNLRLDHVMRILDALQHSTPPPPSPASRPSMVGFADIPALPVEEAVVKPKVHMPITDLVCKMEFQLIVNKLVACSWPSATNLGGIVFQQELIDLQIRFLRDTTAVSEPSTPSSTITVSDKKPFRAGSFKGRPSFTAAMLQEQNIHEGSEIHPLVIDHLFTEMYFVNLYVRDWNMTMGQSTFNKDGSPMSTSLMQMMDADTPKKRSPTAGAADNVDIVEPASLYELQSMFQSLYKVAHTSKVVVSLTENGEVSAKCASFKHSGILSRKAEREAEEAAVVAKDQKRNSKRLSIAKMNALAGMENPTVATKKPFQSLRIDTSFSGAATMSAKTGKTPVSTMSSPFSGGGNGGGSDAPPPCNEFLVGKDWRHCRQSIGRCSNGGAAGGKDNSRNSLRQNSLMRMKRALSLSPLPSKQKDRGHSLQPPPSLVTPKLAISNNRRMSMFSKSEDRSSKVGLTSGQLSPNKTTSRKGSLLGQYAHLHYQQQQQQPPAKPKWNPLTDGYRANLRSFGANHSAFTPPQSALPASYQGKRVTLPANRLQTYTLNTAQVGGDVNRAALEEESSFGNKIWGLRVADLRLLFTIETRDVLFMYVSRSVDLFSSNQQPEAPGAQSNANNASTASLNADSRPVTPRKKSPKASTGAAKALKEQDKATLLDFMAVNNKVHEPSRHAETVIASPSAAAASKRSATPTSDRKSGNVSDGDEIANPNRLSYGRKLEMQAIMGEEVDPEKLTTPPVHKKEFVTGGRKLKRGAGVRGSLYNRSIDDPAAAGSSSNSTGTSKAMTGDSGTSKSEYPTSLGNNSTGFPSSKPQSRRTSASQPANSAQPANSGKAPHRMTMPAKKSQPAIQTYFVVELFDPQINFLDVKTHSSLIIVAGTSSLEGKRLNSASMPPNYGDDVKLEPQRQQEIRLRMDGVSAFTVPTSTEEAVDGEEVEDVVHWKHMKNFETVLLPGGLRSVDYSTITPESPYLRTAISDFQIRSLYIFWTDLLPEDAKRMIITPSKEELLCSFKLELPDLCIDILSWQFYVIMNVIRNVLLVPPPAMKHNNATENEEKDNTKYMELKRDATLMEKHGLRVNMNNPLDLTHRIAREEVKILVEESLQTVLEIHPGTARFVEVYIGRCTWILRTGASAASASGHAHASAAADEGGLVETGFIGTYATLTFGEDRTLSTLFEIQRFWARNLEPGQDSTQFTDKNCVMMPLLEDANETCARCGASFKLENNGSNVCTFHADGDGNPGAYMESTVIDELTNEPMKINAWSCCGRHNQFAAGCSARPHICKEVMVSIRAEANPLILVDNVEVSVIKSFEISIFPGATYDLQMQFTKSLSNILHKYFSIEAIDLKSIHVNPLAHSGGAPDVELGNADGKTEETKKKKGFFQSLLGRGSDKPPLVPSDTPAPAVSSGDPSVRESVTTENMTGSKLTPLAANNAASAKTKPHFLSSMRETPVEGLKKNVGHSRSRASMDRQTTDRHNSVSGTGAAGTTLGVAMDGHNTSAAVPSKKKHQESVYITYFRVGVINVDVSTSGFAINLDKFKAVMEEYVCRKELSDWKKLIYSLEKHLVLSLFKHTASSSLTRIGEFFGLYRAPQVTDGSAGGGVNNRRASSAGLPPTAQDHDEESEEVLAKKRALLLGSPVGHSNSGLSSSSSGSSSSNNSSVRRLSQFVPIVPFLGGGQHKTSGGSANVDSFTTEPSAGGRAASPAAKDKARANSFLGVRK